MKQFLLKHKATIAPIVGFGLAGLIWGLEAYRGTVGSNEVFTNPFSYILGAIAFGILGTGSLVLFSKSSTQKVKYILLAGIALVVTFVAAVALEYQIWLIGRGLISPFLVLLGIHINTLENLITLRPSLEIGFFWLAFLLTGGALGATHSYLTHSPAIRNTFLIGAFFSTASILAPLLSNILIPKTFPLVVYYLFTFSIIGLSLSFAFLLSFKKKIENDELPNNSQASK